MNIKQPTTHDMLKEYFKEFTAKYSDFELFEIGKSIRGREIFACRIGDKHQPSVIYVGAHHGMEHITSSLLLSFISEFSEKYNNYGSSYGIGAHFLCKNRCVYIIPQLNPDGVEIALNGASKNSPLYDRLLKMNGSSDFSHWQANERGVDLNHNYNSGFCEYKKLEIKNGILGGAPTRYSGDHPESEPETSAICKFIRIVKPRAILTLHTQGEEIYYTSGGKAPERSGKIAEKLSNFTGYGVSVPEGSASYGGLTDWFIEEFGRPSFTIECGKGENPLPHKDLVGIYSRIGEMLWKFPLLF